MTNGATACACPRLGVPCEARVLREGDLCPCCTPLPEVRDGTAAPCLTLGFTAQLRDASQRLVGPRVHYAQGGRVEFQDLPAANIVAVHVQPVAGGSDAPLA